MSGTSGTSALTTFINNLGTEIFNPLAKLLFFIAFVVFFWGFVTYLRGYEDDEKRNNGKRHMLYGVIGIFIMLSAWGIINLIKNFMGI